MILTDAYICVNGSMVGEVKLVSTESSDGSERVPGAEDVVDIIVISKDGQGRLWGRTKLQEM